MEKLIEYFKENHEGKNWTLFLIILGLVHSAWWFGTFDFIKKFGTQNPYFIFLEILFIASGITRFLIAIDIFYILANFCLVDDLLKFLWKKRRDEWREWKIFSDAVYSLIDTDDDVNYFTIAGRFRFVIDCYHKPIYKMHKNEGLFRYFNSFISTFSYNEKLPYHIQYWIKLEIKKCRKAIAEEQKNEAKNLSLTKQ